MLQPDALHKKYRLVLSPEEAAQLEGIRTAQPDTIEGHRSDALLRIAAGEKVSKTARAIGYGVNAVRGWVRRWETHKVEGLKARANVSETQQQLITQRNIAIHARFDELYKRKRLRHDDVLKHLEQEFYITARTIRSILKTAVPVLAPPKA
jgi:hypothetical protein